MFANLIFMINLIIYLIPAALALAIVWPIESIDQQKALAQVFTVNWTKATNHPALKVVYHGAAVFNSRMWIISGMRPVGPCIMGAGCSSKEVWSSSDGVDWRREPDGPWSVTFSQAVTVFAGKLWVIGGAIPGTTNAYSDVWSSTNGTTWTREGSLPETRAGATAIVRPSDGKLMVLGGYTTAFGNVVDYETLDGRNWSLVNINQSRYRGDFMPPYVIYNGRVSLARPAIPAGIIHSRGLSLWAGTMWSIGGYQSAGLGSVYRWCNNLGRWIEERPSGVWWWEREGHQSVIFQNRMWVLGGNRPARAGQPSSGLQDDAWYTSAVDPGVNQYASCDQPPGPGASGTVSKTIIAPSALPPTRGFIHNGQNVRYKISWNVLGGGTNVSVKDTLPLDLTLTGPPQFCTASWSCQNLTTYSTQMSGGRQVIHFNQLQARPDPLRNQQEVSLILETLFNPPNPLTGAPESSSCRSPMVNQDVELYNSANVPAGGEPLARLNPPYSALDVYCSWVDKQFLSGGVWVDTLSGQKPGDSVSMRIRYLTRSSRDGVNVGGIPPPNTWRIRDLPQYGKFDLPNQASFIANVVDEAGEGGCDPPGGCRIQSSEIEILPRSTNDPWLLFRMGGSGRTPNYITFNLRIADSACANGSATVNTGQSYAVNTSTVYFEDRTIINLSCPSSTLTKSGPPTPFRNGQSGSYTINYEILSATSNKVSIKDVLPIGLQYNFSQPAIGSAGMVVNITGQEIKFEQIPTSPTSGTIAFSVVYNPSDLTCSSPMINSTVQMYDSPTVPPNGTPIASLATPVTTDVECYTTKKVVTSPAVFPVEPGTRIEFKIEYTARGSSPSFPTLVRITDVGQGFDITGVQPSQGTITSPSGNSFNIDNLPGGVQQIVTYGMPVKEEACTTPLATNTGTLQVAGNPSDRVSVGLLCRLKISGDIGAGNAADVNANPIKVLGPAVVVAGQTVNESGAGVIEPSARRLSTYNLPLLNNGWFDQFNIIKNRLLKEFATNLAGSLQNTTVTIANPLQVVKQTNSGTAHTGSVIFQSSITNGQTGTVILPSANRIQIDGDISASNGPLAIIVDNSAPVEFTGTNDITIGSLGNPVAIIAPNSTVDFGSSRRKINLTGLIVAQSITNLSVPYGTIKFDKTLVEKPPPGLEQLLNLVIAEQAP